MGIQSAIHPLRDLAYCIWLLRLAPGVISQVIERMKMPVDLRRAILAANSLCVDLPGLAGAPPSQVVQRLDGVPALSRYAVFLAADLPELRQILENYTCKWQGVTPLINGHDLRKMGLPPGPAYRKIIEELRGAWLDGHISNPEQEKAFLERLLHEIGR